MKLWALITTAIIVFVGITVGYLAVIAIMLLILAGAVIAGIIIGVEKVRKEHHAKSAQGKED